ncbi:UDP-4-amino-4-deoxy-L-arabinose--oxoglutarate aminotransferase [Acaryochloris thomasi RCC1774]|uniref:UDP-4-amino-4-deoxy-L-arabinose--oxoglutarate aminotransferase n=1 Tax=Acaryochloris thomasi RCC1774 TaxID=1764569 RepID=A0A2W1JGS9_9CYAN|nr:DegT/DnrJ/EryC1/StrS family aminotransferase [Acaryochloris thomasi]PZD72769.1 UDP-4-amino-4-deoxy-L-arabinose--oxoglutarate aminotransferase [Acaryochloris thomasi RCC1774]
MDKFLPFAQPDIDEQEINQVVDSLRSGWLTTGPKTKQFETQFREFLGANVEVVAVNSATAGLHLALEAIGIQPGDEVITTVHTFTATAEVIRYLGADPVFVDINPTTLNIDVEQIEAAISERTKAIIPVHLAGLACEMDAILDIAQRHNLKVVEDAAHALPTSYRQQLIGTLDSEATVYSFYATKTITTGEGGMLVTRNRALADRARIMRLHGINRDAFDRYTSTKPSWYYEIVAPGFKYNMTDLAASLGIPQLGKAWKFQKRRAEIANHYNTELSNLPLKLPAHPNTGDIHSWHLYIIRLQESSNLTRDDFIQKMVERGIGCSIHYIPLHLHPYWRETYNLSPADFPISLATYERAVSLPLYTKMTDDDSTRVIDAVKEILL